MILLGIDPGMKNTGLSAVKLLPHSTAVVLGTKTIIDLSTARTYNDAADFALEYECEQMAMLVFETSLRTQNGRPILLKSSSLTQRTIGAMEILAYTSGMPLHYYDETEVKLGLAGKLNASKSTVHAMVMDMLGFTKWPKSIDGHARDAVAVCLYHQSVYGLGDKMSGGVE